MKRNYILSLLVAGVFVFSMAGVALAEQMYGTERPVENFQNDELSIYAPGSWQYEGLIEAGSLPMGEDLSRAPTGGDEGFTLRESGGITYRLEVDVE